MNYPGMAAIGLVLLLAVGCGGSKEAEKVPGKNPVPVSTGVVLAKSQLVDRILPGTVRSVERATLSARMVAGIESVDVIIGSQVHSGDLLVILDASEVSAQLAQAQANLDRLRRTYQRETELVSRGATSAETARDLADQLRVAEAALEEIRIMNSYTRILAPFDGVVTHRHVEPGDMAMPGMPLITLQGLKVMEAEIRVPESLPGLRTGSNVSVWIAERELIGALVEFSPAADPATRTHLARIALPVDDEIHVGKFVRAAWPRGEENLLMAPLDSISSFGQMERVYVVENGKAELRLVRTAGKSGDGWIIQSGLKDGEIVVVNPPVGLRDGDPVIIE